MKKLISWFDEHLLAVLAGFLLIFIPLYPKIPLVDIIPGYIVRLRLEDLLISVTFFVWIVYLLRGKIRLWENPLFKPILWYLVAGLISVFTAIFILKTVPLQKIHLEKIFLHYLRRIEYFSLFFIFFSAVKNLRRLKIYLGLFVLTIVLVILYGYGQKYLYWPAFSTMNREFSKGFLLYLTPHARVLSTFGGHYDLAAFTMIALLLLWSLFFGIKNRIGKILVFLITAGAFWLLILTASRISFLSYLAGLFIIFFLWAYKKGLGWAIKRYLFVTILSILVMLSFGDLGERFNKLLRLNERFSGIRNLLLNPVTAPPSEKAVFLVNNISSKSDTPPVIGAGQTRPSDVESNIPLTTTTIVNGKPVTVTKQRTYSQNAFEYDLSTAIRFDALWPKAIKGFLREPLFGSGYSTLLKDTPEQFTEAESTDNDYLRALGETGLIGTVTFFLTLGVMVYLIWKALAGVQNTLFYAYLVGITASVFGLLVNASYIDVFEASKVALPFWSLAGLTLGALKSKEEEVKKETRPMRLNFNLREKRQAVMKFFRSDTFVIFLILALAFFLRLHKIDSPLADWHSWRQADTSAVTRNYDRDGINILYPVYDDLSSIASGKPNIRGLRMVEFPVYNIISVFGKKLWPEWSLERVERLVSILASLGTIIFLFKLTKKYLGRGGGLLTAFVYTILPYNLFFNRVILPEPLLVFFLTGMIYLFDSWLDSSKAKYYWVALIFSILSLLIKPTAAFLYIPLLYLIIKYKTFKGFLKPSIILFFVLSILPFMWWRWWISHFPEGIPAYMWLLNGNGIRFKGAFFYWLFAERLVKEILGYWGITFLVMGILAKIKEKEGGLFYAWGLGILLYVTIVATGNIQHDYYQILTIPIITIFVAKGIAAIYEFSKNTKRITGIIMILIALIFMESFGWYQIRDLFNINHPEIVQAGAALDKFAPNKALVVAPYGGDTAFLYQTKRQGWPIMERSLDEMIKMGAQYYVSVNYDDLTKSLLNDRTKRYKVLAATSSYVIIQLVPDSKLPKD